MPPSDLVHLSWLSLLYAHWSEKCLDALLVDPWSNSFQRFLSLFVLNVGQVLSSVRPWGDSRGLRLILNLYLLEYLLEKRIVWELHATDYANVFIYVCWATSSQRFDTLKALLKRVSNFVAVHIVDNLTSFAGINLSIGFHHFLRFFKHNTTFSVINMLLLGLEHIFKILIHASGFLSVDI